MNSTLVRERTEPARSRDAAAVEATAVFKTYGSNGQAVHALRGVDVVVRRGEMVAVMGPSGCGKTTLLNCLSGLDEVDGGTVLIDGHDIAAMPDKVRTSYRASSMGFIFQTYNLLPVLSAVENVELPLVVAGVDRGEARSRAMDALDRVGLRERAKARPLQMSGGQRQRVTIARSLVNNPAIVWADEPTGALDTNTSNDVLGLMEELNRAHGTTFVVVTHDARVGARCHRVIRMEDGRIVGEEANR
jgi:putative ABC transport system ATP-binding protein